MEKQKSWPRLAEVKSEAEFMSPSDVVDFLIWNHGGPVFFEWDGKAFVWDGFSNFLFADFTKWNTTGHPTSDWEPITPEFASAEEALDFPFLDGKSLRERFAECQFFVE